MITDHRHLGQQLDLFHFQDEAPGMVFWHPNGWTIYRALEDYMRKRLTAADYKEIRTPQVVDRKLWEKSGHWDKYRENMFITEIDEEHANEKRVNALKPMNCPCHVQVYNQGLKSYRDLPLRLAEFGSCHRYEKSGSLSGLFRVRNFIQDDAHIFCTQEQIESEIIDVINLMISIYDDFNLTNLKVKLSTRPEQRIGSDNLWDKSEIGMMNAIKSSSLSEFEIDHGAGAFYGPKIDVSFQDRQGRDWQCGTIQLDFNMPATLDAKYTTESGDKKHPVMIHRAIFGSFERFIAILLEHYDGNLPFWLSPNQISILTINDDVTEYAKELLDMFKKNDIRVQLDNRNESLNYKIREHTSLKVPYMIIVGAKEASSRTISVRSFSDQSNTKILSPKEFISSIKTI